MQAWGYLFGTDGSDVKFDVSVRRTGEHKTIGGLDAQQVFVNVTMLPAWAENVPNVPVFQAKNTQKTNVTELWESSEVPGLKEVKAFSELWKRTRQELQPKRHSGRHSLPVCGKVFPT